MDVGYSLKHCGFVIFLLNQLCEYGSNIFCTFWWVYWMTRSLTFCPKEVILEMWKIRILITFLCHDFKIDVAYTTKYEVIGISSDEWGEILMKQICK